MNQAIGPCLSATGFIGCHWIATVSFLVFGLVVGWVLGYHSAKVEPPGE